MLVESSFPSSAWERTAPKLCFESESVRRQCLLSGVVATKQSFGASRSQAELGNEGNEGNEGSPGSSRGGSSHAASASLCLLPAKRAAQRGRFLSGLCRLPALREAAQRPCAWPVRAMPRYARRSRPVPSSPRLDARLGTPPSRENRRGAARAEAPQAPPVSAASAGRCGLSG